MAHTSIVSGYSTVKLHRGTVRPGMVLRIFYAMVNARQLKADREVAEILARHGPLLKHALPTRLATLEARRQS